MGVVFEFEFVDSESDWDPHPGTRAGGIFEQKVTEGTKGTGIWLSFWLGSARGVAKRSPFPIRQKLLIRLRIKPRQIPLASPFARIFARQDIPSPRPIAGIRVVIRMCRIHWHEATLAPVFATKGPTAQRTRTAWTQR